MILTSHNPEAGLFSHINFLITILESRGSSDLHVDWSEGLVYNQGCPGNLFEHLFLQLSPIKANDQRCGTWPHHRYTYRSAANLYKESGIWRWRLNACWRKLSVLPELLEIMEQYCADWNGDETAVHIRNLNIGVECPGGVAPTLADYGNLLRSVPGRVYLATDNQEAVEYCRRILGERLMVRNISRSENMQTEYHQNTMQTFRDAQECLMDALIMARCARLIHSVSNIATAVLYMNPTMGHTFVTRGHVVHKARQFSQPDRIRVQSTIERNDPDRVLHIEHPRWTDWIHLYNNGVFVRHSGTDSGFWSLEETDILVLRWLDWNPERFRLARVQHRGDAHPHRLNSRNTLKYRHAPELEAIVVKLKGGLGNQMFQYAFGLALARSREIGLRLIFQDGHRTFALDHYGITLSAGIPPQGPTVRCDRSYDNTLIERVNEDIDSIDSTYVWLEGWFQNEELFRNVANEIRATFARTLPLPERTAGLTPIAVHVRLGDYVGSRSHCVCTPEYFANALGIMRDQIEDPIFLIFSDEPERAKEYVSEGIDVLFMPPMDEHSTLAMMQTCKALIIANSTFSWWAAWLSESTRIICPNRVLKRGNWNLWPRRWMQIPWDGHEGSSDGIDQSFAEIPLGEISQ